MDDAEERGVDVWPSAGGPTPMSPDEIPDDVLAEQDAEERQVHDVPVASVAAAAGVGDDVLVERDADERAAEESRYWRAIGG
jgi:hypothetical protein